MKTKFLCQSVHPWREYKGIMVLTGADYIVPWMKIMEL